MLKTKNKHLRYVITFFAVLCSSLLQTFVIESFVHSAGLLSGGFTGVAILIDRAASLYGGTISTSLALVALNLPVAVLCYRSISPRFTLFSLLQVGMTSLFLKYFSLPPIFDDILLSAVFGGFLMGISIVLALKGNASTGGTDFIALYVSNKTGKSIWSYVFMFNACILCIFGYLFGWLYAGYSILFQFISTKTVETFHHRYERLTLANRIYTDLMEIRYKVEGMMLMAQFATANDLFFAIDPEGWANVMTLRNQVGGLVQDWNGLAARS